MRELIIHDGPRVESITSPIPTPGPGEVVVRVHVTASNPKDWKYYIFNQPINQGDDMAGIVHAVGHGVGEFHPGDRVFAFHQIASPHGTYAEYSVAPATTTYHLPEKVSFREGATVPLAAFTAAWALYRLLGLPEPWRPEVEGEKRPLLVYGASGAVGAFAVKLARASNIHPIVGVAGRGGDYVRTLIDPSKGDVVVDYRGGPDEMFEEMCAALQPTVPDGRENGLFSAVFDAIAEDETASFCARVVRENGRFAHIMPLGDPALMSQGGDQSFKKAFRKGVIFEIPSVPVVNGALGMNVPGAKEFGNVWMRAFARGLQEGWLTGHPFEVVEGGLDGVEDGLRRLKEGKASAVKYVYEVVKE